MESKPRKGCKLEYFESYNKRSGSITAARAQAVLKHIPGAFTRLRQRTCASDEADKRFFQPNTVDRLTDDGIWARKKRRRQRTRPWAWMKTTM